MFVALPSGPEFTAVFLACLEEDAVAIPIPHRSTPLEWRRYMEVIDPDLVFVESSRVGRNILGCGEDVGTVGRMSPVHMLQGERAFATWGEMEAGRFELAPSSGYAPRHLSREVGLVQFTSGSTGVPKGIVLSRRNILAYLENNTGFLESLAMENVFCPMPQCHAFGGTVVMEGLWAGSSLYLTNQFVPASDVQTIRGEKCTVIQCSPSYVRLLLQLNVFTPQELPSLHTVIMGTSPTDQELVRRMREFHPNVRIVLRYGLTETMGPLTRLVIEAGDQLEDPGLVGAPVPGVVLHNELSCCSDGEWQEVRASSQVIAAGELMPDGSTRPLVNEDGFFPTGDLGFIDQRGRLHLRGRKSLFIKRHGFRIDPFEIEELLKREQNVTDAAVFGVPDSIAGERIVACIETTCENVDQLTRTLITICKQQLSPHKVPERILVVNPLPKTVSGKPDRTKIRNEMASVLLNP